MRAHKMIYLDWAASAPPEPAALDEARDISLRLYANPSSPHAAGREAGERLGRERARFARLLGVEPGDVIFTSGATEANSALLLSLLHRHRLGGVERQKAHVVVSGIEHASVFDQARGLQGLGIDTTVVAPRMDGRVDPSDVAKALTEDTVLVSVMLVNNEMGAVQDIQAIARAIREFSSRGGRKILLHTDAVQALGKIPFSLRDLDVDAASFSAHKLGGLRGTGALYLRAGAAPGFLSIGGSQENGRRPGTENLAGIAAMASAAEIRIKALSERLAAARELTRWLIAELRAIPGARILPGTREDGGRQDFSPYIVSTGFPPLPAEVVVRVADAKGYCISTGSACSSKKKDHTRVQESMGLAPEIARSAVRISTGPSTTREELQGLLSMLRQEIPPLLAISKGRGA
jgi:cysteine desulfurase